MKHPETLVRGVVQLLHGLGCLAIMAWILVLILRDDYLRAAAISSAILLFDLLGKRIRDYGKSDERRDA